VTQSQQAPIELDPAGVARRAAARYQQLIAELVDENSRLETYIAHLLIEQQAQDQPAPDAWGDTAPQ
jgi:hypothetical protein